MNDKLAKDLIRAIDNNTKELSLIKIAINSGNQDLIDGANKEFGNLQWVDAKQRHENKRAGDKVTIF